MREIRFRAWDKRISEMIYPSVCNKFIGREMEFYPVVFKVSDITHGDGIDLTIMQFTNLHDKNGKEIYEGDIVIGRNYKGEAGQPRVVEWSDNGYHANNLMVWAINQCEVIGNIYETPELLKAEHTNQPSTS